MFRIMLPYSNVAIWDDFNRMSYILTSLLCAPPVLIQKISNGHSKNYSELLVLLSSSEPSGFLNPCAFFFFTQDSQ